MPWFRKIYVYWKSDSFLELPSEVIFPEAANAAILKHDKWADVWETLTTDADLNYTDEKETVSLSSLVTSATSAIYQAITDGWTMCVGYSGGKDSHSLLHLFLMALIRQYVTAQISANIISFRCPIRWSKTLRCTIRLHRFSTSLECSLLNTATGHSPCRPTVSYAELGRPHSDWTWTSDTD